MCLTSTSRHLPPFVVGYLMGHASPGNPEIPLVWYVAAFSIVLGLAALCARMV